MSVSRISAAVASVAIALLTACAPEQAPSIAGPGSPSYDIGVAAGGQVSVCISNTSPAGDYEIAISSPTNLQAGDVAPAGPLPVTPNNCVVALTKGDDTDLTVAGVTLTASNNVAGTWSMTCSDDIATIDPFCSSTGGATNTVTASASGPHGSIVIFTFVADQVETEGCTYTQGWWKNKGSATSAAYDFDGGDNNGLSVLNTPVKGNPYIALAHQYIAATLNIANGASIDGAAETAYNAATAYFAAAAVGNPLVGGAYTKSQLSALTAALDLYNQGLSGPLHCDAEVIV